MKAETVMRRGAEVPEVEVATKQNKTRISGRFIESACRRLREGKRLRRQLPPWGRVHIDRQLPFLVIYRRPEDRVDPGMDHLVVGEASYMRVSGERARHDQVSSLVREIAGTLSESFGAFLIIEIWSATGKGDPAGDASRAPRFRVVQSRSNDIGSTVEVFEQALRQVRIKREYAEVDIDTASRLAPPGLPPLMTAAEAREVGCRILGLEVRPVFRDSVSGLTFPLVRRALHRGVSRSLKRAIFEFTRQHTSHRPRHYQSLGRRSMVKAVWEVDKQLAKVSNMFDFILQVTPVNADEAWRDFRRKRFEEDPEFTSRPLRLDPSLAKRELFRIPIERVEDPTLARLFRDQQDELDRKLTMLGDRGTKQFLYGSLQVFGGVDDTLLALAYEILNRVPSRSRDESSGGAVDAAAFAGVANEELERYRGIRPDLASKVEVRPDIVGLMVSRGNLLVGARNRIPRSRVKALIAHEIGTHVVTYVNGKAQPFRQLYVGLPGYEELQEGMAVLAEYLVGGLSRPRLRLLAARVVAVRRLIEGASFREVFRELDRAHDFAQQTAFNVTMRVFRSGGLTKDATYLRGLVELIAYLREGGKLDPLLVGKIGFDHLPIIKELRWRKVLLPAPLRPHHLDDPAAVERLAELQTVSSVLDLVKRRKS